MQQGFYWVQQNEQYPQVWYFADGEGGGWYQSGQDLPVHQDDFDRQGYHVVSEKLEPPGS
ncbi:MAG: hypothetical protein PW844_07075 [Pantoea sp.]|uniref:hypothetical protein n=1 Tax=Pantoea TaxID=53335 RepID=UPI002383A5DB|nr:hypothetical protein [Pantoea sp.]MDE1186224.1 hypothetical protein [Pantoea sp.]